MRVGRWNGSPAAVVLAGVVAVACSAPPTQPAPRNSFGRAELLVTEDDDGRTVGIQVGESVTLNLGADPSRGLAWTIAPLADPNVVAIDGPEFHPSAGTSGPGVAVWRLRGIGPGSVSIVMTYAPSADPADVQKSFRFVVSVA